MNIIKGIKDIANVQAMRTRLRFQKGRHEKLETQVKKLQALVKNDLLSLTSAQATYKGNKYTSYSSAVEEINNKYVGTADWGVLQTGSIVDLRAAFIIGEGIEVVPVTEGAEAEIEWVKRFLEHNDLDQEMVQEFAKEAEIEGKIALKLAPDMVKIDDEEVNTITVRFISWTDKKYKVETDPQDYTKYTKLTWKPKNKDKNETLNEGEFVYKKFGGRISKPNEAAPKIMKCLTQVENLDKALRDWREIDRLFASPIPHIEVENAEVAKKVKAEIAKVNWKIKKMFVHTGKLAFASPDIQGIDSLEREITTLAKMISGTTGIPVHFLGFPDLMSNRSTSENLMELVSGSTLKERETWIGAYDEVIAKGMEMTNMLVNQGMSKDRRLDPKKVKVTIPIITKEHYEHIEKIYLPAAIAGKISDEAFQEKLPGFDMEAEQKRKAEKEKSEFERVMKENEDLKTDLASKELFGGGGGTNAISE